MSENVDVEAPPANVVATENQATSKKECTKDPKTGMPDITPEDAAKVKTIACMLSLIAPIIFSGVAFGLSMAIYEKGSKEKYNQ